jgi:hypothetical protein
MPMFNRAIGPGLAAPARPDAAEAVADGYGTAGSLPVGGTGFPLQWPIGAFSSLCHLPCDELIRTPWNYLRCQLTIY